MKTVRDPDSLLTEGLSAIREQFKIPAAFPAPVLAAAEIAARRQPSEHSDRLDMPFVTLDPATSTDLDQAFAIEQAGADLLLHYAIADVAWFVEPGGVIDAEAWSRGLTTYLPDGKAGLYPPVLAENAASLLPEGPRPAVIFTVRIAPDGTVKLDGVERAVIRSRAKLAYDQVTLDNLPAGFADLAVRIHAAEQARGAARVDPPEQEVERDANGRFTLKLRPQIWSEQDNAALSLACNLAVAQALLENHTGLFRVMAGPDAIGIARLRHSAKAFGLNWPEALPLQDFERTLDAAKPADAAFLLAVRKAGDGAGYVAYQPDVVPWHAAMAATYCHATAPLRRLADRYVVMAALAVANGRPVPDGAAQAFPLLPAVMAKAEAHSGQVERAVIDLAEAAILAGREGETFAAVVTDLGPTGARIQLCDLPVVSRVATQDGIPGQHVTVHLDAVDPLRREVRFSRPK